MLLGFNFMKINGLVGFYKENHYLYIYMHTKLIYQQRGNFKTHVLRMWKNEVI